MEETETTNNVNIVSRMETHQDILQEHAISIVTVTLLVSMLVLLLFAQSPMYRSETVTLPIQTTVVSPDDPRIGVSNDNTSLHFGRVRSGMTAKKPITVTNKHHPAVITLQTSGNVSPYITVQDIGLLPADTNTTTHVSLTAEQPGHFTGSLTITKRRSRIPLLTHMTAGISWLPY